MNASRSATAPKRQLLYTGAMVVVVVCAVAGALALVLARLDSAAARSQLAVARLYEVAARLYAIEGNEWRLIAEQQTPSPVEQELAENLTAAAALIDDLSTRLPDLAPVKQRFTDYRRALDEEVRLFQADDYAAARRVDVDAVDPAFDKLNDAIHDAEIQHEALAAATNRETRVLGALAVTAAAAIIAVLLSWFLAGRARSDEAQRGARMLRESERRYRALFEESRDAIAVTGVDGRIIELNRAAMELFGGNRDGFLGQALSQFYEPASGTTGEPSVSGQPVGDDEREVRVRRENAAPRECVMASRALHDDEGRVIGSQVLVRDVTEHNLLDRQLQQAQKMEAVGRLAGGIAHDFNNLLTSILGYSDLLLDEPALTAEQREDVEQIGNAGRSAASLTQQLLAFSRKQVIIPTILDLSAAASAMGKILRRTIGEDVAIVLALDPRAGRAKADQGQIEQVLMNLAINARDAMPEGGTLTIATANVTFDRPGWSPTGSMSAGRYVMLSVNDTGVGMTPAVQAHMFEPFFSTKGVGKGTGLGLSTVYGIVRQHGGEIVAESAPGRGSTFRIYLPRIESAPDVVAADAPAKTAPAGSETILIVEDNEGLRRLAVKVLQRQGYLVLEAGDSQEALRVARQHPGPIQLLLTDMVMPGAGGAELAGRVTAQRRETRVLYMSGYTEEGITSRGVLQAGLAFLQKPFTPDVLVREVRKILDEGRPSPPQAG